MDFVCVCVRIMKSGSVSLTRVLEEAFADRRTFYLPTTFNLDGELSKFQRLRHRRAVLLNLVAQYRTVRLAKAFNHIASEASDRDLISGGHVDFPTASKNIPRPLKIITILRDPIARALSDYNYTRQGFLKKNALARIDAGLLAKMSARVDFEGFLDFQLEHRHVYGDIASRLVGWDGQSALPAYFESHVFHAGVLEESGSFADALSEKMGKRLSFPHEHRTASSYVSSVGGRERAKIESLFARDCDLYAFVREHHR